MKFEKISKEQFEKDFTPSELYVPYEDLKLPKRATKFSAGYDFFSPISFTIYPGTTIKFPTGVRVRLDDNKFLAMFPRSGQGFKYRLQLDNTVGIIDADYYNSDNEGHIWIKITNDSKQEGNVLRVNAGDAIAQGVIMEYFTTEDDDADGIRNGGFGSTNKK